MGNIIPINIIEKRALEIKNEIESYALKTTTHFAERQVEVTAIAKDFENKIILERKKYDDLVAEVIPFAEQNESLTNKVIQVIKDEGILNEVKMALKTFDDFIFKSIKIQKGYSMQTIELNEALATEIFSKEKTQTAKILEEIDSKKIQLKIINYLIEKHKVSSSEMKVKINQDLSELISFIDADKFSDWLCQNFISNSDRN